MKSNRFQIGCLAAAISTLLAVAAAQAVTISVNGANGSNLLTNGGALSVGTVINGVQGGGGQINRDVTMVNNLLSIGLNTYAFDIFGDGQEYHRGNVGPAILPAASAVGAIAASGGGVSFGTNASGACVSVTLTTTFQYLVAAYDGPNGGVMVYNVSSLAAGTVIQIPRYAQPSGAAGTNAQLLQDDGRYQLTGWSLINPNPPTQQVPDGGSAMALLGIALVGVEALRRKLRS
jgi:hypothetical protein